MTIVRAVQYGCGPIGCNVIKFSSQRPDIVIVGAMAIDKKLLGCDLGEVDGLNKKPGLSISDQNEAILSQTKRDVVFFTAVSSLKVMYPQLEKYTKAGVNMVSTCEELCYSYRNESQLLAEIDKIAKAENITVLDTGVKLGFLTDTRPLVMTGVCQQVKRLKVAKVQDTSPRQSSFQKKIGVGCTVEEFKERVVAGTLRHVGLAELIEMIARGLGCELDETVESIEPIVTKTRVKANS